jgi:hypothetical protein
MTKRIFVLVVAAMLMAAVSYAQTGSVSGTAQNAQSQPLSGVRVQLRNVDTGQLAGSTTSATNGAYSFTGLNPANYVVEILDAAGNVIGTSASLAVAAGGVISGVTVAASATLAAAATAGGLAAFFTSTGGILVLAGVGAGVAAGFVAANNNASPSR